MKTKKDRLSIIPIGGLEEVGKNMMVVEYKEEMIIIDCGLKFAKLDTPGVDFVVNDFSYVKNNQKKLKALVITHGHLDHVGAIPELLKDIDVPVYCTTFTRSLIEKVLGNYPTVDSPKYIFYIPNKPFKIGSFEIEGIPVNHSIIEANSLAIKTPVGVIIHTGDWRIDKESNNKEKIDVQCFKRYGKEGVLALFSDSTNAIKKGYNISERSVSENLENIFLTASGRIVIATFSTQVNRIKEVIRLAKVFNRKIAICGRSMIAMIEISMNLNVFDENDLFIDPKHVKKLSPEKVVILTTGTQGEERAGLQLMAKDAHRFITLKKEDTIVFSSSFIPGNEQSIGNLLNLLYKKELNVITNRDQGVHTTGHASEEEIRALIGWVKPKYFIPIHGEPIQLVSHKKIAMEEGIAENKIFLLENGDRLDFSSAGAEKSDKIKLKDVFKEGKKTHTINKELFEERNALSENGALFISVEIENLDCKYVEVQSKGFVDRNVSMEVIDDLKKIIENYIKMYVSKVAEDLKEFEIGIKREVRKYIHRELDKNPLIFLKGFYR